MWRLVKNRIFLDTMSHCSQSIQIAYLCCVLIILFNFVLFLSIFTFILNTLFNKLLEKRQKSWPNNFLFILKDSFESCCCCWNYPVSSQTTRDTQANHVRIASLSSQVAKQSSSAHIFLTTEAALKRSHTRPEQRHRNTLFSWLSVEPFWSLSERDLKL